MVMATTVLVTVCLSALLGQSFSLPNQALISPGAVGKQTMMVLQNSRHNLWYLARPLRKPSSYPSLSPVPYAFSLNDQPSEQSSDAPRSALSGIRVLERGLSPQRRLRRQAVDLALSHTDSNGRDRPVGRVHGFGDLSVTGNSRSHHHVGASAGVGSVLWRSRNNRHSVGVGASVDHHRGSYHGYRYSSRPRPRFGIGYRMGF